MSLSKTNALIDHLDKTFTGEPVSPEQLAALESLIAGDEEAAREWNYLQLAVESIQDDGLREQVTGVRQQWESRSSATVPAPKVRKINLYKNVLRVAACALVLAGGAAIFKYIRLSSSSLYSDYYTPYELNTSRGASDASPDALEKAYTEKNWPGVLVLFSTGTTRSNKTDFLAGMADLELKKYDDAIAHFEQIIASNTHAGTDYFEDEAEYYLAISWLANNKVNEAMPILEKIRANKAHLYHDKVLKMSFTDLRLVQYKENK